jgi:hypothetical protein
MFNIFDNQTLSLTINIFPVKFWSSLNKSWSKSSVGFIKNRISIDPHPELAKTETESSGINLVFLV